MTLHLSSKTTKFGFRMRSKTLSKKEHMITSFASTVTCLRKAQHNLTTGNKKLPRLNAKLLSKSKQAPIEMLPAVHEEMNN